MGGKLRGYKPRRGLRGLWVVDLALHVTSVVLRSVPESVLFDIPVSDLGT